MLEIKFNLATGAPRNGMCLAVARVIFISYGRAESYHGNGDVTFGIT